jgi:hypothetical protein
MAKKETAEKKVEFKPVVIKHVTMPTLKLLPDVPAYVKITEKIFEGKTQKPKEGEADKKAPMIFNVINLESGEVCQMVAGTVVHREIVDNYPKDGYVNKCFMIVKGKKKGTGDRGYFTYEIAEIEEPK